MSNTGRVFDHYLLTGLHVRKAGWKKSWKELAAEGARANGVDEDRAEASVKLIKQSTQNNISTCHLNFSIFKEKTDHYFPINKPVGIGITFKHLVSINLKPTV